MVESTVVNCRIGGIDEDKITGLDTANSIHSVDAEAMPLGLGKAISQADGSEADDIDDRTLPCLD